MNITILGTGAYGLALSLMFHKNKNLSKNINYPVDKLVLLRDSIFNEGMKHGTQKRR